MALSPTLELRYNNGNYYFIDTTGLYDVDVNAGGYGAPNILRSAVTRILIEITFPDTTIVTLDSTTGDLDVTKLSGAGTSYFNVILHKYVPSFLDGLYSVKYTVFENANEYVFEDKWFYVENIKSCIFKQMAKLTKSHCTDINEIKDTLFNWATLKSIQFNAAAGTEAEAEYLLGKLQKWCSNKCC